MRVLKKGLRRRERADGAGLGRKGPQPHPFQLSLCSSGPEEGTAPRSFFYKLKDHLIQLVSPKGIL